MILAIDPGQHTGWAASDRSCGTLDFTGMLWGEISDEWRRWLSRTFRERAVEAVAYEMVFVRTMDTALALGLVWDACAVAMHHNVTIMECTTQAAKSAVGVKAKRGESRAGKAAVWDAVIARGWRPLHQHEADAIAVLAWAENRMERVE